MRFLFAFFAKSADVCRDGSFAVLGGGFCSYAVSEFPLSTGVTLIAHLELSQEDRRSRHEIALEVYNPAGEKIVTGAVGIDVQTVAPPFENEESTFTCIYLVGMLFPSAGVYRFRLMREQAQLGEISLHVALDIPRAGN